MRVRNMSLRQAIGPDDPDIESCRKHISPEDNDPEGSEEQKLCGIGHDDDDGPLS